MQYRTMRISVYSFIISAILLTASCSSINKKCKDITFGELSKDVQDTLQCVSQKVIEEDYSPKAMIDFSGKCKFCGILSKMPKKTKVLAMGNASTFDDD